MIRKELPVRYDKFIIKGDLDIRGLDLPKDNRLHIVTSTISITNCRFEGAVFFNDVIFKNEDDRDVNFRGSQFCSPAYFSRSSFCQGANFEKSQFDDNAEFRDTKFCSAVFTQAKFSKYANFRNVRFCNENNEEVIFDGANFIDYANFKDARFYANTSFNWAHFSDYANFNDAKFKGNAKFDNVTIKYGLFENTIFGGKNKLSMSGTNYEKLFVTWKNLYEPKYVLKFRNNGFLDIGEGDNHLSYSNLVYTQLIENFKKFGFFEDADGCYYYYRNRCREKLDPFYKGLDWVFMLSYGYGVKPLRPIGWSLFFLVLFGLIYAYFGNDIGFTGAISIFDGLNISSTLLLSGTKLIAAPNYATTGVLYWIFNFEKLLGSLFFGLFILSIGRTIIR
jgi:uncharacterized protein YjbI with pentapeptide repeats